MRHRDDTLTRAELSQAELYKPHGCPLLPSYWGNDDAHVLVPDRARVALVERGRYIQRTGDDDFRPLVKLFNPSGAFTWLIVAIEPDRPSIGYGIADAGMGHPEIGSFDLDEIAGLRGRYGLPMERDLHFESHDTLAAIAERARAEGAIDA